MFKNALEGTLLITDLKRNSLGRTEISEYTTPPMNALVTALPGLMIIFVLAGGVNALAGVLFVLYYRRRQYNIFEFCLYSCI